MRGIKKHTHSDREKVIREMVPFIKKKFGDNLIALAASGSYARNEDFAYSDLELTAFVKKMPRNKPMGGLAKIRDGMLVEMLWMTRETYLKNTLEPNENWHMSGSDTLLPILNKKFIEDLGKYRVENLKRKCLDLAVGHFSEVQESVTKVLNAILQKNRDGIPLLALEMMMQILRVLSFINQTPLVTFATFMSQAREFAIKPASFDKLTRIMVKGEYTRLAEFRDTVIAVYSEFEDIFEQLNLELYDDNVDPNKPVHEFRKL